MNLRYRLFLYVGLIFFLTFAFSLFFETYLTDKNLTSAQVGLRRQLYQLNEQKRLRIEEEVKSILNEDKAQIDSLLVWIGKTPTLRSSLFLNRQETIWRDEALLILGNKWIDFVQVSQGAQSFSLIPMEMPLKVVDRIPIDGQPDFSWVISQQDSQSATAYIGVRFKVKKRFITEQRADLIQENVESNWDLALLFLPQQLLSLSLYGQDQLAQTGGYLSPDSALLFATIRKAQDYLKNTPNAARNALKIWQERPAKAVQDPIASSSCLDNGLAAGDLTRLFQKGDQTIIIASLSSLLSLTPFGNNPIQPNFPMGIAHFFHPEQGQVLFSRDIFFSHAFLDAASYHTRATQEKDCFGVAPSVGVINTGMINRSFIGNSLELSQDRYLTIGIEMNSLLEKLVLAFRQDVFLVYENRVIAGYRQNGVSLLSEREAPIIDQKVKNNISGGR